jgi:hypothetical protein
MVSRWFTIGAVLMASILSPGARAQTTLNSLVNTQATIYDDATLLDPGTFSVSVYSGFSSTQSGYYISAPGLDFAVGLNRRLELSSFGGFAASKDGQDHSYRLDDNYLGLKILLLPKGEHLPAIAIKPSLEILNTSGIDPSLNPHRTSLVLPLLIEKEFDDWSISYTGGYITRGQAFSTLKLEGDWWEHLTPTLVISYTQSTNQLNTLRALGLNRGQINASAGLAKDINSQWSIFVDAGRSIGRIDAAGSSFECTVGVSFTGRIWGGDKGANRERFPIRF